LVNSLLRLFETHHRRKGGFDSLVVQQLLSNIFIINRYRFVPIQ